MDPQQKAVADEFDSYESNYSDTVDQALAFSGLKADFFTRVKSDYLTDLLSDHFDNPKAIRVLDVGCGVGSYHGRLVGEVGELHGVDVSPMCVKKAAQQHSGVKYKTYNGDSLPYDDASFDAVFTICVMHHVPVPGWDAFVQNMHRVLRPGGLAVVFEHNPNNPLTMRVVNNCPFDADAVLLKAGKTSQLFEGAGFEKVGSRYIISIPPANALLRSIDGLFSWMRLGAQYYVTAQKPASARPSVSQSPACSTV